jgi:hypothetical protein
MELNSKKLIKALGEMLDSKQFTQGEITKKSSVHNLGRIVQGSVAVTDANWFKLHTAYPDLIPFPEYENGEHVFVVERAAGKKVTHGSKTAYFSGGAVLSSEEASLITALRKLGDGEAVEIYKFLGVLAEKLKVEE